MEIVGYIARSLAATKDPYNLIYFILQYFFIVVAPVFFSASIYTILSFLINAVGGEASPLPPKAILWIFILCDIIATGAQVGGAANIGVAESHRKDPTTANNVLLGGLAFQCFDFAIFLSLLGLFIYRARDKVLMADGWKFICALVSASLLVYLRTAFRLAETAEGLNGFLTTHEVFFGCLEFAPVVVAVWIFAAFHPGKWIPQFNEGANEPQMMQTQQVPTYSV
ncbi:MAG: hypothetical protein Q9227_000973 [Pyrenula ochraceoflavens]